MKGFVINLYNSIYKMIEHDGVEHSGYMSFMMLLSIFPFFVFILALTSFFGASELGENFIAHSLDYLPSQSLELITLRINEIISAPPQSLLTLAILGTLWTSSSFVECLRTILNRVYEIKNPPNYILRRLLSIAQFLILSSAIILAMVMLVIIPILLSKLPKFVILIQDYESIINLLRYLLIFLSLFLTVCSLYYVIPNASLQFKEVVPGAILTVILWIVSGFLLTKYLSYYNQLNIVYGSLGSIIVTMLFFYIVNMIFIIGAEYNYLISRKEQKLA